MLLELAAGASILGGLFGRKKKQRVDPAERERLELLREYNRMLRSNLAGLGERLFREPKDYWTDDLLEQRRRSFSAMVNRDIGDKMERIRAQYYNRGMINSGMLGDAYLKLAEDGMKMAGAFHQDQLFEQANRRQQLDAEAYNRALSALGLSLGTPVMHREEDRTSSAKAFLDSTSNALTTLALFRLLR